MPTLRDLLAGYRAANDWEREEEMRRLPELAVEDSVRQYFELQDIARRLAPDAEALFLEERMAHYEELHLKLVKIAQAMGRAGSD